MGLDSRFKALDSHSESSLTDSKMDLKSRKDSDFCLDSKTIAEFALIDSESKNFTQSTTSKNLCEALPNSNKGV